MPKQELMKQAVERMVSEYYGLVERGVRPGDMPDDLLSAHQRLRSALEHLNGRIQLERLCAVAHHSVAVSRTGRRRAQTARTADHAGSPSRSSGCGRS